MTEFVDQDLSGSRLERVSLRNSSLSQVQFNDASLRRINFSGARIRGALFQDMHMTGIEMWNMEISAELGNVVINGVDIGPLIDAELNRRMPERAKMNPTDAAGFKDAWATLQRLWQGTIDRARSLPEDALHTRVGDEWSFIQTLRHLNFATAAWVGRMILGDPSPWHPLDLPWDEAPGWEGIPWDKAVRPTLDEVLEVRRSRQAMVAGVVDALTDEQLTTVVSQTEPGWPQIEQFPFKDCLLIVIKEEWEHRLFAERDLGQVEGSTTSTG